MTLTLVCVLVAQICFASPAEEIYSALADNIVTLETYDPVLIKTGQGSGIIIDADTGNGINQLLHGPWILTNYHVIRRAGLIVATARHGTKSNAWVIYFDRDRDIALIQTHLPLKFSKIVMAAETKTGSEVFAIGAPQGLGWTLSNGIVSALRKKSDQEVVQISAPISPGSSGGGLFNSTGELIGITSFEVKEGQNLNFAIRITPEFLASLLQFRGKGASFPSRIPESDWNTGYTEPSGFDPQNPLAIPAWHSKRERMQIWDAHTQVISNLEKRLKKLTDAMSSDDKTKLDVEYAKAKGSGRPSANSLVRLMVEVEQAYALRYHEFPDDLEGWSQSNKINTQATREDVLYIQQGIKHWPTDFKVMTSLLFMIATNPDVPSDVANALFRHVEQVVDRLPTRREVNDLIEPFKNTGRIDLQLVEPNIQKLVGMVDELVRKSPYRLPVSDQRQAKVAGRLRQKGWLEGAGVTLPSNGTGK